MFLINEYLILSYLDQDRLSLAIQLMRSNAINAIKRNIIYVNNGNNNWIKYYLQARIRIRIEY